jgi:hypothetical protein
LQNYVVSNDAGWFASEAKVVYCFHFPSIFLEGMCLCKQHDMPPAPRRLRPSTTPSRSSLTNV